MSRSLALLRSARRLLPAPGRSLVLGAWIAAGIPACERARDVAVRVSLPGPDSAETPAAGVGVVALPYDRDSVLEALAGRARLPKPDTAALDSLFRSYRVPFAAYTSATMRESRLRDSLAAAGSRADSLTLARSLPAAQAATGRARAALDAARRRYVGPSDSLRARVRQWEDSTYQGYDSIVRALGSRRGREPTTDTTGATGWAHFHLDPGPWWMYARGWDAADPNAEWYWNVPVTGDTVLLSSRSGRRQPKY